MKYKNIIISLLVVGLSTISLYGSVPVGIIKIATGLFIGGQANDVKIDANGKILVCGYGLVGGLKYGVLARLNTNGTFDTSFNTTGYVVSAASDNNYVRIALQGTNIAVISKKDSNIFTARYSSTGALLNTSAEDISRYGATTISYLSASDQFVCLQLWLDGSGNPCPATRFLNGTLGIGSNYRYNPIPGVTTRTQTDVKGDITFLNDGRGCFVWTFTNNNTTQYLVSTNNALFPIATTSVANYTRGTTLACVGTQNIIYSSCCWNNVAGVYQTNSSLSNVATFTAVSNSRTDFPYGYGGGLALTDAVATTSIMNCACNNSQQPYIARFLSSGNLDTTFNNEGGGVKTETSSTIVPGMYQSVAMQADGKSVVAGFTESGSGSGWIVARYTTAGRLDRSFGPINYIGVLQDTVSPFDASTNGFIYTTTIDQSGNLVVGGQYNAGALSVRYTSSAGRDGNFGNNGVADLTALLATATVQKIINSGTGYLAAGVSGSTAQFTTFKLTTTGGFDSTFNSNGIVTESTVGTSAAYDLLINGTALSVSGVTSTNKLSVINYNTATGARNSSLGNNGLQTFNNYGTGTMYALNTTTGSLRYGAGQSNNLAFVLPLYDQSGVLQDTVSPFNASTNGFIYTTTIDQSGNIIVGGQYNAGALSIRYTTSAGRSGTFGANGVANLTALAPTATVQKIINSGTGYLAAGVSGSTAQFTTFKLTGTGGFDIAFNGNGVVVESAVGLSSAYDLLINGTALSVAGVTNTNKLSVINYNTTTGARNSLLGNNGVQTFNKYGTGTLYALNTTTGSLRYGAGQGGTLANIAFVGALVDQTGLLQDTASPFNASTNGFIYTSTIDQLGNIVVGGQYDSGALSIRYTSSAGRSGTFGNNGVADLTALLATATVQKIVNSGTGYLAAGVSNTNQFTTFKLTNTGGFDIAYNGNGSVVEGGVGISSAYDILVTGTGLLSVSGTTSTNKLSVINYGPNGIRNSSIGVNGLQLFNSYGVGTLYALNTTTGTLRYGAGQGAASNTAFVGSLADQTGMLQDTASPFNSLTNGFIYTSTIDQSGKIVVGGQYDSGALSIRYTTSAGRDGTFGANGVANVTALLATATVQKIINSSTGYLGAGVSSSNRFTTFSLDNTGVLNGSYGSGGVVVESTIPNGAAFDMLLNGTALAVSGFTNTTSPSVINYNSQTGARDATFKTNGYQQFPELGTGTIYGIKTTTGVQRYGAGQGNLNNTAFVSLLVDKTGILQDTDAPFNTSQQGLIYSTTIAQDGTLLNATHYSQGWYVVSYLTTGTRNTGFATDGVTTAPGFTGNARPRAILCDSTGKIVVTGTSMNGLDEVMTTARYTSVGAPINAVKETTLGIGSGLGLTLLDDDSLVVSGFTTTSTQVQTIVNYSNTLTRLNVRQIEELAPGFFSAYQQVGSDQFAVGASGDTAIFWPLVDGTGLLQDVQPPFHTGQPAQMYAGIIDQDGNYVLCGNYNNIFTIVRYTANGERDHTFGPDHDGVAQYSLLNPSNGYSILQSSDGSYYVAGEVTVAATITLAVFKYTNDGTLDTSFGTNGVAQGTSFGQGRGFGIARNTVDGSLLVTGQITVNSQLVPAFVLYDASGSLVTEFGTNGAQLFPQYGTGALYSSVVTPSLQATGAGGMSALGSNDTVATLVQIGQGSDVIAQINTGF